MHFKLGSPAIVPAFGITQFPLRVAEAKPEEADCISNWALRPSFPHLALLSFLSRVAEAKPEEADCISSWALRPSFPHLALLGFLSRVAGVRRSGCR
ncbi:protein of unknown function [Nitrospina watsonii]|uniref:Uncharacterized protein n=1 Tax=Nitrospina watsonii TaxID=1323948 RepID=A0ABN8W0B8_9BACT|nr:protein of unknown function [Nitrospina watsonii]